MKVRGTAVGRPWTKKAEGIWGGVVGGLLIEGERASETAAQSYGCGVQLSGLLAVCNCAHAHTLTMMAEQRQGEDCKPVPLQFPATPPVRL